MSGATWQEYLQQVFQDIPSADQVNLQQLTARLQATGTDGIDNIVASFAKLSPEQLKEMFNLLWNLAHIGNLSPGDQRMVYAQLAQHYEKLFDWEDMSAPGWFIIPGPFFP